MKNLIPTMYGFLSAATGHATVADAAKAEPRNRAERRAALFGRKPATGRERRIKRLRARLARGANGAAKALRRAL